MAACCSLSSTMQLLCFAGIESIKVAHNRLRLLVHGSICRIGIGAARHLTSTGSQYQNYRGA